MGDAFGPLWGPRLRVSAKREGEALGMPGGTAAKRTGLSRRGVAPRGGGHLSQVILAIHRNAGARQDFIQVLKYRGRLRI